jgi:Peptidase M15
MLFPNNLPLPDDSPLATLGRRKMMGALSLAGLGAMVAAPSVAAFTGAAPPPNSPKVSVPTQASRPQVIGARFDTSGFPAEWLRTQGTFIPEYARYLSTLKLQKISPFHVIEAHAKSKGEVWNCLPPKMWWTRMGYTLRVADRIALEMGVSEVEVVSAYRCPLYNAHCEGAKPGSWHQANVAVDVKFPCAASYVTAASRNLRDRGLFKGGIGGYDNFTHIDTRGENINW